MYFEHNKKTEELFFMKIIHMNKTSAKSCTL